MTYYDKQAVEKAIKEVSALIDKRASSWLWRFVWRFRPLSQDDIKKMIDDVYREHRSNRSVFISPIHYYGLDHVKEVISKSVGLPPALLNDHEGSITTAQNEYNKIRKEVYNQTIELIHKGKR